MNIFRRAIHYILGKDRCPVCNEYLPASHPNWQATHLRCMPKEVQDAVLDDLLGGIDVLEDDYVPSETKERA
jgi:hypothetical protein